MMLAAQLNTLHTAIAVPRTPSGKISEIISQHPGPSPTANEAMKSTRAPRATLGAESFQSTAKGGGGGGGAAGGRAGPAGGGARRPARAGGGAAGGGRTAV